ncbi:hypothetical protein [Streptomyces collinus]|uniref:hypothetical protein n=1 Tax=Streptomyces collinus TaxID=42684 RepID=UPI0036A28B09
MFVQDVVEAPLVDAVVHRLGVRQSQAYAVGFEAAPQVEQRWQVFLDAGHDRGGGRSFSMPATIASTASARHSSVVAAG